MFGRRRVYPEGTFRIETRLSNTVSQGHDEKISTHDVVYYFKWDSVCADVLVIETRQSLRVGLPGIHTHVGTIRQLIWLSNYHDK
jgi:hypothetical protein